MASSFLQKSISPARLFGSGRSQIDAEKVESYNFIARQLTAVNQNILAVGSNIELVAKSLTNQDRQDKVRVLQENTRRVRLAEKETFGGAEKALESAVVRAVQTPIKTVQKAVSGPFEQLKNSLLLLFGGWLTDKLFNLFDESGGTFRQRLESVGLEIVKGIGLAVGAFTILNGGFLAILGSVGSLAFKLGKFIALAPFKILKGLFSLKRGPKGNIVPTRPPRGRTAPGQKPGGNQPKGNQAKARGTRLGRIFGRIATAAALTTEFKGAREQGYSPQLSGLKSLFTTGAAAGAAFIVGGGLAATGVGSAVAVPSGIGAAAFAGMEANKIFDLAFGSQQQQGVGQFDLYKTGTSEPYENYDIFVDEQGDFEIKDTSFAFGQGSLGLKKPILTSKGLMSGEESIPSPSGKNAELLEAAISQLASMNASNPERVSKYRNLATKVFGSFANISLFESNKGDSSNVTATPNPQRQAAINTLSQYLDDESTDALISLGGGSGNKTTSVSSAGAPTIIPMILTRDPANPYRDIAKHHYGVRV